jgi:hypothetical protein
MAAQRLRDSADQVRTEWVRARVEAMSSGHTQVFRFTPEGDAYTIDAYASEDDSTAETAASPLGRVGLDIEEPAASRSQQRRLPDKVQFVADQAAGQSAGQRGSLGSRLPDFGIPSTPSGAGSAAGTLATGDAGQSPPIFFYADGTCSDAQVWLRNEYGQTVSLSLRGLTGVVLVSEVRSAEARVQ